MPGGRPAATNAEVFQRPVKGRVLLNGKWFDCADLKFHNELREIEPGEAADGSKWRRYEQTGRFAVQITVFYKDKADFPREMWERL